MSPSAIIRPSIGRTVIISNLGRPIFIDGGPSGAPGPSTQKYLYGWGYNLYGESLLGYTPLYQQIGTSTDWDYISATQYTNLAIKNGELWGWGENSAGQLGLGDTTNRSSPVQVGSDTNWAFVAVGGDCAFAIKTNGTLWAWGWNDVGQLGLGNTTNYSSPVQVGSDTNWSTVSANYTQTYAVRTNGTLWCWGENGEFGYLPIGDTLDRSSPTQIGSDTNWSTVKVFNQDSAIALKTTGTMWAWGWNQYGQLGLGDTTDRSTVTQIGSSSDWAFVSAGLRYAAAVKTNGTLWSWGDNLVGALGVGDFTNRSSPTQVGSDTNWESVSCGTGPGVDNSASTLAIKTNGTLWAWGVNNISTLGFQLYATNLIPDYNNSSYDAPIQVGNLTTWDKISVANLHFLAKKDDGTIWEAGYYNSYGAGELTQDYIGYYNTPILANTQLEFDKISQYESFTMGIKNNTLYGWGFNADGQLAQGNILSTISPVSVLSNVNVIPESVSTSHITVVKTDGTLWAWGYNSSGQLGLGDTTTRSTPIQVGSDNNWYKVAIGTAHTLAIKTNGTLWAWGYNSNGQLGQGDTIDRSSPVQIGSDANWSKVFAGTYQSFAIKTDGTLWAWGYGSVGGLGLGDTLDRSSPVQVGSDTNWNKISSDTHTLATKTNGTLWACGDNSAGQLGLGDTTNRSSLTQIGSDTNWSIEKICASINLGSYAIKTNGTLWAWGDNAYGLLGLTGGREVLISYSSPIQVGTNTDWVDIQGIGGVMGTREF